jgi:hypothetical protein
MKTQEFKLRIETGLRNLIDDYFGSHSISDRFINSTLKIMLRQNSYKLDEYIGFFADENGCVDENIIIEEYSDIIGENGVVFDLRNFVKNETLKSFLPNKALVIKAQDIRDMFIPK